MTDPSQPQTPANSAGAGANAAPSPAVPQPIPASASAPLTPAPQVGPASASAPAVPTGQSAPAYANPVPPVAPVPRPWMAGNGPVIVLFAVMVPVLVGLSFLVAKGIVGAGKEASKLAAQASAAATAAASSSGTASGSNAAAVDSATQSEAEALLARVAGGDTSAAQQAIAAADGWTGRTHRTPRTDQLITSSLNSRNVDVRGAAVAAELALDGIPRDESGVARAEQAVGNPNQRAWALWMLGALANRGVDPVHTAKIIESYLDDPDVRTRGTAVDALALVGTDETVPMLLDRFRNDPSPVVQERAACDLSEAGMYTHAQRMTAAASLAGWLDDSLLSAQQRQWAAQALADISGQNFGPNSSAWKSWLAHQPSEN